MTRDRVIYEFETGQHRFGVCRLPLLSPNGVFNANINFMSRNSHGPTYLLFLNEYPFYVELGPHLRSHCSMNGAKSRTTMPENAWSLLR